MSSKQVQHGKLFCTGDACTPLYTATQHGVHYAHIKLASNTCHMQSFKILLRRTE